MGIFERNYDYGFRTEGSFRGPRRGYDRGGWGRGRYGGDYDRSYMHGLNFDPYYGPRGASGQRGWGYRERGGYDQRGGYGGRGYDAGYRGHRDRPHGMGWFARGWGFGHAEDTGW